MKTKEIISRSKVKLKNNDKKTLKNLVQIAHDEIFGGTKLDFRPQIWTSDPESTPPLSESLRDYPPPAPTRGETGAAPAHCDKINHPSHYNQHPSGIECIQIAEHYGFNIGNVIKYCWRAGLKTNSSDAEDLKKAAWYLDREIKKREQSKK